MNKVICALSLGGLLLLPWVDAGTGRAQAQAPARPPLAKSIGQMGSHDGDLWLPLLLRTVKLTLEQDTKIRGILSAHQTGTAPLGAQPQQAEDELAARLFGVDPVQLARDDVQTALEIRAVLTPDQVKQAGQVRDRLKQLYEEAQRLLTP